QNQRNGVIPGLLRFRGIDSDAGILLQLHDVVVHSRARDLGEDLVCLCWGYDSKTNAANDELILNCRVLFYHEAPAAVIQQPVDFDVVAQYPVSNTISL